MDKMTICKHCDSHNVIKYGIQSGTQMYYCKDCKRKFKDDASLFNGRVPAGYISSALSMYYRGMSVTDICQQLRQEYDYMPSKSVVFKWIEKFSTQAVKHYAKYKPNVGDTWVADETVLHLDGKDVWLWDVIDLKTRFLLASKLSFSRHSSDAVTLFELAKERAGKSPTEIRTDKYPGYPDAIHEVFSDKTYHLQSRPATDVSESTNSIERWHSTLKERLKVMRCLRDPESALAFTDSFIAYYNFIRPHEGLDLETPAESAGIKYDAKSWTELIHLGEPKKIRPEIEPQYVVSNELAFRRKIVTGKPYKPGRKRRVIATKPKSTPAMIMATRKLKRG
jgi:putative transposase